MGSGISDYLDPLLDPRCGDAIIATVRAALASWSDWDICDWQDLSRDTPLEALGNATEETPCTEMTLGTSFEEFLAARPKDLRRNLRRYREKAEALGSLTFEVSQCADSRRLDALIELHHVRWAKSGEPGMIEANRSEAFLREIVNILAPLGRVRLFTLCFAGRIAAIILALCDETTIFPYLSAFDPQYETFGFGRELLAQALRYAHDNGYRRWNFLRGTEPYKFSWGAHILSKCRVVIYR
jgi:CelD/BcsL family acetyltransferase involved in cellulose biosynthesis